MLRWEEWGRSLQVSNFVVAPPVELVDDCVQSVDLARPRRQSSPRNIFGDYIMYRSSLFADWR